MVCVVAIASGSKDIIIYRNIGRIKTVSSIWFCRWNIGQCENRIRSTICWMIRSRKTKNGISNILIAFKPDRQWIIFVHVNTYTCKVCRKWYAIRLRFKVVITIDLHQRCIVTIFCANIHLNYFRNPWIMLKNQIGHF